jgi:hypothetical protein
MTAPICTTCNDTHRARYPEDDQTAMCRHCPVPCVNCGHGFYCAATPCACACHVRARDPRYIRIEQQREATP